MKRLYQRLLDFLNISGRELAVFLLALLLAFSIWLIHNLSLKYNDYLSIPVRAHSNLRGYSNVSSNTCDVTARCRATGYKVITSGWRARRKPVEINFPSSVMKHSSDDRFYVTSSDLTEYIHLIYGNDVSVEHFVSDTLFFRFPYQEHKRVPVHPVYSVSYRHQHMSDGQIEVSPDTVTIYGEPFHLENIERVFTKPIKYSDLSHDVRGVVELEKIRGVRFSDAEVEYELDVVRYVELKVDAPVEVLNVPEGKVMLVYPSSVEVALKCAFPLLSKMEDIRMYVDYNDFVLSKGGKCPVKSAVLPRGVIDYECTPIGVDCVVEDR